MYCARMTARSRRWPGIRYEKTATVSGATIIAGENTLIICDGQIDRIA